MVMKKKNKIFPNTTKNFDGRWDDETGENGGVDFCTRRATFDCGKDLDAYFAPLFVSKEKAIEEYNEIFGNFMDDFLRKC